MAGFGLLTDIWTYYPHSFNILILICSHQRSIRSLQHTLGNTYCLLISETCNMLPALFLVLGIMHPQGPIMLNAPSCCKGSWQVLQTKTPNQHSFFFSIPRTCIPLLFLLFEDRSNSVGMMGRAEMEEVVLEDVKGCHQPVLWSKNTSRHG